MATFVGTENDDSVLADPGVIDDVLYGGDPFGPPDTGNDILNAFAGNDTSRRFV
jgi:hypothetical protein